MSRAVALVAAALLFGVPAPARAHDPGLSSLDVRVGQDRIVAVLSLAGADARAATETGERLEAFAMRSVELIVDGVRLSGAVEAVTEDAGSGRAVTLVFDRVTGSRLTVRSIVPARLARGHRELLTVRTSTGQALVERMLEADVNAIDVDLGSAQRSGGTPAEFFGLGVRHILGGYDHLLFLGALLLGVGRLRGVVSTVTAFTVAHSLTLSLAALGLVRAPAAVVEPLIAASVVFVGLENLMRRDMDSRWKVTFAFGLVHGFGFAGALQELGLGTHPIDVVLPLGSFNAGVEAGQIGVAMLVWPLMSRLNARPELRVRLAPVCSLLVAAAGAHWMVERTFF